MDRRQVSVLIVMKEKGSEFGGQVKRKTGLVNPSLSCHRKPLAGNAQRLPGRPPTSNTLPMGSHPEPDSRGQYKL